MFVCKICKEKYSSLEGLYSHLEEEHSAQIPPDMSTAHFYYYLKTGREHGNCVMCKQPTTFNEKTKKYNRFCNDPACKIKYKEIVDKRMIGVYGKVNLLNDPNHQRKMLMNRSISGVYNFKGIDKPYVGSYELDFLKTMDLFFDWDPSDIVSPSPHTYYYVYEGEKHFYIPDFYIMSLGLEIEVKDGGDNPNMHHKIQDVDKEKEKVKDKVMHTQKINHYVKLTNKNYYNLFEFFRISKEYVEKYGDYEKIPKIILDEDIKSKVINSSSKSKMSKEVNKAVNESYVSDVDILKLNGYEPVEELFGAKKAEKQARREKQQMQEFISHTVQINKSELPSCIKEFERLTNSVKNILKKEMPGCKFYSEKINHQTREKGGYEVHFIDVKLFEMDDNNFTKFKNNSKNKLLKTADEVYDYADDMLSDINKRIVTPIKQLGLKKNTDYDEWAYSKYRDGKPYITVDVTPNLAPRVFLVMTLVIKQDNIIKESYELVKEGYVFSKDNLEFNIKKFGKENNILFITGLSGSGKSTIIKQYAEKYNAENLEFDAITSTLKAKYHNRLDKINRSKINPIILEYLDKEDPEGFPNFEDPRFNTECVKFLDWLENRVTGDGKLYILEGMQIFLCFNPERFIGKPMIIMGTSMVKSMYRSTKRYYNKHSDDIKDCFIFFIKTLKRSGKYAKNVRQLDELADVIGESYEPVEEGYVFSKDNLYINFEKFESGKSNICLITGLSGSGKSTLGKQLANKYHAKYVELDLFEHCSQMTKKEDDVSGNIFTEYFDKHKNIHTKFINNEIKFNSKEYNKLLCDFMDWVIPRCKNDKVNKYILEGVQIYSHGKRSMITPLPLIMTGASSVKSIVRMYKREYENGAKLKEILSDLKNLPEVLKWYLGEEKKYNKFKKEIATESYVCFPLLNSIISSKYDDIKSKEQYKRDVNAFKQHFLKGISRIDNIDDAKAMKGDLQSLMSYLNAIKYTNNYSEFKNIDAVKEIETWIGRVAIPELDLKINKYSKNLEPVNEYTHNITFAINNNLQRGIFGMMDNISSITIDDSIQLKRKNTVMQVITENLEYDDNTTIIKFGTNKDVSLNNDLNNNIGSYLNWNKNNGVNALLKNVSDELFNSTISVEDFHKIEGGDE